MEEIVQSRVSEVKVALADGAVTGDWESIVTIVVIQREVKNVFLIYNWRGVGSRVK